MTTRFLPQQPLRIAYVVNNAAFFVSHRLPIALAARAKGCEVMLFTGHAGSVLLESQALLDLQGARIAHRAVSFGSAGVNVVTEFVGFLQLVHRLWRFKPDIVHCASPKGILYGGLAARLIRAQGLVLAVSGMGYLFTGTSSGWKALARRCYQSLVRLAYRHPNKFGIVQNRDDLRSLVDLKLAKEDELALIPGSGVRLGDYARLDTPRRAELVVLPARMLKDKGVVEFVQAARSLRAGGCDWRFALVGTADYQNPSAVPIDDIRGWVAEGIVEWWGHQRDMVSVLAQASIVCLPSYREGMPKALLEGAAAGCAVVTTDVVGCREAVIDGQTGDLVPPRDAAALATCLLALIGDRQRRERYAIQGKQLAASRFSLEAVVEKTLSIYQDLMHRANE